MSSCKRTGRHKPSFLILSNGKFSSYRQRSSHHMTQQLQLYLKKQQHHYIRKG